MVLSMVKANGKENHILTLREHAVILMKANTIWTKSTVMASLNGKVAIHMQVIIIWMSVTVMEL